MKTPIIAGVATMPGREEALREMVASIAPQVDTLCIYDNGAREARWISDSHDTTYRQQVHDIGDTGKFWQLCIMPLLARSCYYLSLDDDLRYPPDYVARMVEAVERYRRRALVTLHGRSWGAFPIESYYHSPTSVRCRCLGAVVEDTPVMIPGSGCAAFHPDTLRLSLGDFLVKNMADIWLGIAAARQRVPCVAIAHEEGWIEHLDIDHTTTIWALCHDKDERQTRAINEHAEVLTWNLRTT